MKPDSSRRSCVRGCWWTVATCSTLATTATAAAAASANNRPLQLHCFFVFFFLVLSILLQSCPENKVLTATVTFNFHLAEGCIVFIWKDFFFSTVLLLIVFSLFAKDLCSTVSRYNSQLAVEQLAPLLLLSTVCVVATDTVSCTTAHTMVDFTGFFKQ